MKQIKCGVIGYRNKNDRYQIDRTEDIMCDATPEVLENLEKCLCKAALAFVDIVKEHDLKLKKANEGQI